MYVQRWVEWVLDGNDLSSVGSRGLPCVKLDGMLKRQIQRSVQRSALVKYALGVVVVVPSLPSISDATFLATQFGPHFFSQ